MKRHLFSALIGFLVIIMILMLIESLTIHDVMPPWLTLLFLVLPGLIFHRTPLGGAAHGPPFLTPLGVCVFYSVLIGLAIWGHRAVRE